MEREDSRRTGKRASEREAGRAKRARRLLVAFSRVGAFARSRSSLVPLPFAGRLDAAPRAVAIRERVCDVCLVDFIRYLARGSRKDKTEVGHDERRVWK